MIHYLIIFLLFFFVFPLPSVCILKEIKINKINRKRRLFKQNNIKNKLSFFWFEILHDICKFIHSRKFFIHINLFTKIIFFLFAFYKLTSY